jgi:hypothetical protein
LGRATLPLAQLSRRLVAVQRNPRKTPFDGAKKSSARLVTKPEKAHKNNLSY